MRKQIPKAVGKENMKFKFGKSLKNDYILCVSFISIFIMTGLFVFSSFFPYAHISRRRIDVSEIIERGSEGFTLPDPVLIIIFGTIIIGSIICFLTRLSYLKSFTDECRKVNAKVIDIHYIKDRCGVDVEFMHEGIACKKHFTLMNNSQTKYIHMDSEVELLIKDGNPKKSLIAELYFEAE